MKKKLVLLLTFLILIIIMILILFIRRNSDRMVNLYDYRLIYSDKFLINSTTDLRIIDEIISNMNLIEEQNSNKVGGFIIIEELKGDTIESYRVQGSYITKEIYKESYENLISTTYYELSDKYYQLLVDICDRLRMSIQ
ncbi:MAG: hypothetical protein K0S61_4605 [Anaerocolumna sp.]|jgi:hypothetical protein|nr:hypothetical protein [Anaerocolumna sp.]